jgi:hypothetical protein
MFAVLHSDINSLKSGLLHLTGPPYCKKSRSAKVKNGIINIILKNFLIDRYNTGRKMFIKLTADFLIAHSTISGYYSWRNTVQEPKQPNFFITKASA